MNRTAVGIKNARFGLRFFPEYTIMKLRPVLILLLFVVSAGILVWLYYAASREPRKPKKTPHGETIADLDSCARRKHAKALQYDHFAGIAAEENRLEAERLFRAMAFSVRLQEQNCAAAILRLGGRYTPPAKIIVFGGTTESNLARSIEYERQTYIQRHGTEIRRALEQGNRYVARLLVWASAGDLRNITLLEQCQQNARQGIDSCCFTVCPVCGNLYTSELQDYYCPFCLADGARFIRFE